MTGVKIRDESTSLGAFAVGYEVSCGRLVMTVSDKARGGAVGRGTGLVSMAERTRAVDDESHVRAASPRATIRVLVADDHAAIRAGLVMILGGADDIEVVGEAADGATAVRMARLLEPDVVLMDVRMPGTDGIEATRQLVRDQVCEVLVLTTFDLDEYVHGALRAGAAGFLLKSVEAQPLVDAIRLVAAGDGVLAPTVTRRLMRDFAAVAPQRLRRPKSLDLLTEREVEVLVCLGEGMSNQQIGRRLHIGETTVKTHVSRVLTKLDLRSRVQAAILAQEAGLVSDDPARP